ncbi:MULTISPECIES: hypothetical protein [unclassified Frankia]|uniref:hypothetical protein n=1 Tax=unclassified Frankia TaxID=2632575 RepID=UPI001EF68BBB|nr:MULTISPECIES: hypothetical protein [unclassified Frankia]
MAGSVGSNGHGCRDRQTASARVYGPPSAAATDAAMAAEAPPVSAASADQELLTATRMPAVRQVTTEVAAHSAPVLSDSPGSF